MDSLRSKERAAGPPHLDFEMRVSPASQNPVKPPSSQKLTQNLDSKRDKKSQKLA